MTLHSFNLFPKGSTRACAGLKRSLVGHTDIGTVTILAHNGIGGLQVLLSGAAVDDEPDWAYIRPEPGGVIVDLGDALTEWSGNILRSDMHRVIAAPGEQRSEVRYSIAYLVRPVNNAKMAPLRKEWCQNVSDSGHHGDAEARRAWTALEWERRKNEAITSGQDVARSKGGIALERRNSQSRRTSYVNG